jgi:hypothetical protein
MKGRGSSLGKPVLGSYDFDAEVVVAALVAAQNRGFEQMVSMRWWINTPLSDFSNTYRAARKLVPISARAEARGSDNDLTLRVQAANTR